MSDGRVWRTAGRSWRPAFAGAVLGAAAALGGCLDLSLLPAVAFPPGVPGLPASENWVALPVGAWMTEGDVEALGMVACLSPACGGPAVVGLFGAGGRGAARLREAAAAPAALASLLGRTLPPSRTIRRPAARVDVAARAVRHGRATGIALAMRRADGTAAAFGEALVAAAGPRILALVVVGPDAARVSRLADDVAAAL